MTNKAMNLLIFISILHGAQSDFIEYKAEVNTTVGQNLSLPCIVSKEDGKIVQLQWHKEGEHGVQKLVLYNPDYSTIYYVNATLELVKKTDNKELQGSILHLQNVTEKDSGDYVCEITSFPDGSMKTFTKVQVTEPKISMITSPDLTVIEGDTVSVACVSDPPPDKYMLLSSQNQLIMESQDGKFTVQNISRHISHLICQPFWSETNQYLQNLKAAVDLTVDFLDNIECNSESQIQVEAGANLTIICDAKSSTTLSFVWMKDNMTLSSSASLKLWSLSSVHAGIYTLTAHSGKHSRMHRQKDFTVTVINRTHTEYPSSTVTMETTPQISSTTMTTHEPIVTMPTSQPYHTSITTDATTTEEAVYFSTSAPSTGNVTVVHVNITTPYASVKSSATTFTHTSGEGRTRSEICCTSSPGSTSREINYTSTVTFTSASISKATVAISNVSTITITREVSDIPVTSKSHVVFVLIPVLLMLVLIGFLYRQYQIQKRLDLPPPFKPPPPPVKYTSARNHDIPTTDILI